ncbi:UNVERIFIED_CONTAM: hypothetical protein HDU68_011521 [Siphonaria sp. JEL0065]|nr:hypothetical protein HDU68_011521 [Siphonaria sp. JEL0065]
MKVMLSLLLSLGTLALASPAAFARESSGGVDGGSTLTIPLHSRAPAICNWKEPLLKRDGSSFLLDNVGGGSFFTRVNLGNQLFDVDVDTGSSDLWVPSIRCGSNCPNTSNLFDPVKSSNFKYVKGSTETATILYGTGSVKGAYAIDTLVWGNASCNVKFLLVDREDKVMKQGMQGFGDGIMGLTFQGGLDTTVSHQTVTYALATQNQLPNYIFSLWFNQSSTFDDATGTDPNGGRIIIGGADSNLYVGGFTFVSVIPTPLLYQDGTVAEPTYFWGVNAGRIGVNGRGSIAPPKNTTTIIDSGTSLIIIDKQSLDSIVQLLAGSLTHNFKYLSQSGIYAVDCNFAKSLPSITLTLNNRPFELSPNDYIMYDGRTFANSDNCALAFSVSKDGGHWIIGDPFLYRYYSVYDLKNKQMGFALAANGLTIGTGSPLTEAVLSQGGGYGFGQIPSHASAFALPTWVAVLALSLVL